MELRNFFFATPKNFKGGLHPEGEKEREWFLFSGNRLLVSQDRKSVPALHELSLKRSIYFGTWNDKQLFAGEIVDDASQGWVLEDLRGLYGLLDEERFALAGRALQFIQWDRTSAFCGKCGSPTFPREHERCRECSQCQELFYLKEAPAMMALVKRGDQILLARGPHFPGKMYSVIAGFLDPGETLEQCVAREVMEEVGIEVKNIRYYGSQPWPFSHSLMIAFTCEWKSGEIVIDPAELEDAAWFDMEHLPEIPTSLSIARFLIDAHVSSIKSSPSFSSSSM
jgi:NAD+ diphosphatase